MMTPLEIKGAMAGVITSVVILAATFMVESIGIATRQTGNLELNGSLPKPWQSKDEVIFFKAVLTDIGRDADGGEDAPSLLKLQISGAHMALVIQGGIKGGRCRHSQRNITSRM